MRRFATMLLLGVTCWASDLPDSPAPQAPFHSQISARPFIVQQRYIPLSGSSRFEFDPMKILIHSRYRFPRAMGKIWAFEDKYFDPNAPALPSAAPLTVLRNIPSIRHRH
jgi:hypothetical protein